MKLLEESTVRLSDSAFLSETKSTEEEEGRRAPHSSVPFLSGKILQQLLPALSTASTSEKSLKRDLSGLEGFPCSLNRLQ